MMKKSVAPVAVASLLLAGCYNTHHVHPAELPKLNNSYANVSYARAGNASVTVVDQSVRHLVTPDGRTVEIKGEPDVTVVSAAGERIEFKHPLIAEIDQSALVVRGSNRAMMRLELSTLSHAEVTTYDRDKTMWTIMGVGLVAVIPMVFLLMPDAPSS